MESVVFTVFVEMKRSLKLEPSPLILHTLVQLQDILRQGKSYLYVSAGPGPSSKKG